MSPRLHRIFAAVLASVTIGIGVCDGIPAADAETATRGQTCLNPAIWTTLDDVPLRPTSAAG